MKLYNINSSVDGRELMKNALGFCLNQFFSSAGEIDILGLDDPTISPDSPDYAFMASRRVADLKMDIDYGRALSTEQIETIMAALTYAVKQYDESDGEIDWLGGKGARDGAEDMVLDLEGIIEERTIDVDVLLACMADMMVCEFGIRGLQRARDEMQAHLDSGIDLLECDKLGIGNPVRAYAIKMKPVLKLNICDCVYAWAMALLNVREVNEAVGELVDELLNVW